MSLVKVGSQENPACGLRGCEMWGFAIYWIVWCLTANVWYWRTQKQQYPDTQRERIGEALMMGFLWPLLVVIVMLALVAMLLLYLVSFFEKSM
jgi:hypothetical protein